MDRSKGEIIEIGFKKSKRGDKKIIEEREENEKEGNGESIRNGGEIKSKIN